LGAKDCINYKKYLIGDDYVSFSKEIKKMMQGEADIYFDNIGEDMLTSALLCMKDHYKVILCGATATYNNWKSKAGILNQELIISKRIECKGILYYHYT
jgi:NADPH-dependent curcumin reductase CurA